MEKLGKAQLRELTLTEAGHGANVWRENSIWDTYMTLLERELVTSKPGEWEGATLFEITDAGRAALAAHEAGKLNGRAREKE